MIFSSSILKLNALAMWAPKTAFNEELVLSRLIAFAFSHGLGPFRTSAGILRTIRPGKPSSFSTLSPHKSKNGGP
jgi:hypothetical protein